MHFDKQVRFFVSRAAADSQTIYYTVRHFISKHRQPTSIDYLFVVFQEACHELHITAYVKFSW